MPTAKATAAASGQEPCGENPKLTQYICPGVINVVVAPLLFWVARAGWLNKNRTGGNQTGQVHPSPHFTNGTLKEVSDSLHAKGLKFGIYLAAGESTCGNRAGTLYSEFDDAALIAASGIDYLKSVTTSL